MEAGGAALEFPMLSVALSTVVMVQTVFMSLLPLKGPDSVEEEPGLTDVSKGELRGRVETILLSDAILRKKIVVL